MHAVLTQSAQALLKDTAASFLSELTSRRLNISDPVATDPLWRRYELSVAQLLAALPDQTEVLHDQRVDGNLSLTKRQVDILAKGTIIGLTITVVVECKKYKRAVDVIAIDGFVGKLLDLGAERGIMYSYGGFTSAAVTRALNSFNPAVLPIALDTPEIVQRNFGVPGYPADLLVQEFAPQWIEEMNEDAFRSFLHEGSWNKHWS